MRPSSPWPSAPLADPSPQADATLGELGRAWAGAHSRLTPTGAPYEWVFTAHDPQPRLTREAAPPPAPFPERLAAAAGCLPCPDGARVWW